MNTAPPSKHLGKAWIAIVAVIVIGATALGYFAMTARQAKASHHTGKHAGATSPTAKQVESLALDYPPSTGRTPESLTSTYDAVKNRTATTLTVSIPQARAGRGYQISDTKLALVSEFSGTVRAADKGESSIDGVLTLRSSAQGALAGSEPIAQFETDLGIVAARPASKHKSGYTNTPENDGARERIAFKIDTKDLMSLAKASRVKIRAGLVESELTSAQLDDLREFTARLNPKLK